MNMGIGYDFDDYIYNIYIYITRYYIVIITRGVMCRFIKSVVMYERVNKLLNRVDIFVNGSILCPVTCKHIQDSYINIYIC